MPEKPNTTLEPSGGRGADAPYRPTGRRRNLLDATAKKAYKIWAHRLGVQAAWEQLPNTERAAWIELVEFLQDEPECQHCGEILFCVNCDTDALYNCPDCETPMTCPKCGFSYSDEAAKPRVVKPEASHAAAE